MLGAEAGDLAAEGVDLGAALREDVRGHRGRVRADLAEGLERVRPGRLRVERHAGRVGDGDDLLEHRPDEGEGMLVGGDVAHGPAQERRDRPHRAGQGELRPDHDVGRVERLGRQAGRGQRRGDLLHPGRERRLGSRRAEVGDRRARGRREAHRHDAGAALLGADGRRAGNDPLRPDHLGQPPVVAEPVLHRRDPRLVRERVGDRAERIRAGERLREHDHELDRLEQRRVVRSPASGRSRSRPRACAGRGRARATASMCSRQTSTRVTSWPASARCPPKTEPIAPAPRIATFTTRVRGGRRGATAASGAAALTTGQRAARLDPGRTPDELLQRVHHLGAREARAGAVVAAGAEGEHVARVRELTVGVVEEALGPELGRGLEPVLVAVRRRDQHDQLVVGTNGDTVELGRLGRAPDRALHRRIEPQRLGREAEHVVGDRRSARRAGPTRRGRA